MAFCASRVHHKANDFHSMKLILVSHSFSFGVFLGLLRFIICTEFNEISIENHLRSEVITFDLNCETHVKWLPFHDCGTIKICSCFRDNMRHLKVVMRLVVLLDMLTFCFIQSIAVILHHALVGLSHLLAKLIFWLISFRRLILYNLR